SDGEAIESFANGDGAQDDVAAHDLLQYFDRRERLREFVHAGFQRFVVTRELHVDERDVLVANHAFRLEVMEDRRGALTFADFHALRRVAVAAIRRRHRAPEEPAAADRQQHGEEENREQRADVLSAAAARLTSRCYGVLRAARSSRYDWRMTAAACMSITSFASRALRPDSRMPAAASTGASVSW